MDKCYSSAYQYFVNAADYNDMVSGAPQVFLLTVAKPGQCVGGRWPEMR